MVLVEALVLVEAMVVEALVLVVAMMGQGWGEETGPHLGPWSDRRQEPGRLTVPLTP